MFLFLFLLLLATSPCWSQANVNENLETASIYVDAAKGNDSNNGSKTAPLKTIGAAVTMALANNDSSIGSRVTINPGTYRESVVIGGTKRSTNLPITFQAATNGTVFVSGADPIKGWSAYQGSSTIYQASWPFNFGLCPAQAPPARILAGGEAGNHLEHPEKMERRTVRQGGRPLQLGFPVPCLFQIVQGGVQPLGPVHVSSSFVLDPKLHPE